MDECDSRVGVVGIGKKDARKGGSKIRKECGRVARGIDRVERSVERRKGIELRERVSKGAEVAMANLEGNHLHTSNRI